MEKTNKKGGEGTREERKPVRQYPWGQTDLDSHLGCNLPVVWSSARASTSSPVGLHLGGHPPTSSELLWGFNDLMLQTITHKST